MGISPITTRNEEFLNFRKSTQALFFHLAVRADHTGYVESPERVIEDIGAKKEDLLILLGAGYLHKCLVGVNVIMKGDE